MQPMSIILRSALHETELHRALARAFPDARIVRGQDSLPADLILPDGLGVLIVEEDGVDEQAVGLLCRTFKTPLVFCTLEALQRVSFALPAQRDACTILPCASCEHVVKNLLDFVKLTEARASHVVSWDVHASAMERELAERLAAQAGVPFSDVTALLHALPLVEIVGATYERLLEASPLVPASTDAIWRWMSGAAAHDEAEEAR
jgi:hypothetical protein